MITREMVREDGADVPLFARSECRGELLGEGKIVLSPVIGAVLG